MSIPVLPHKDSFTVAMAVRCDQVCISDGAHQCFKLQNMFWGVFEGCFWGYFFIGTKLFCARSYLSCISC